MQKLTLVYGVFGKEELNGLIAHDRIEAMLNENQNLKVDTVITNQYSGVIKADNILEFETYWKQRITKRYISKSIGAGICYLNDGEYIMTQCNHSDLVYFALTQKILYKKKWIAHIIDLPPGDAIRLLIGKSNNSDGIKEYELTIKYADAVVFLDEYQKQYLLNFFNIEDCERFHINPLPIDNKSQKKDIKKTKKIVFRHLGELYGRRNLSEFINAFQELTQEKEYKNCILELYSKFPNEEIEKNCNNKNIIWKGRVESDEAEKLIASTDILVSTEANLNRSLEYFPFSTSKIRNYLSHRRPIIHIAMEKSPNRDLLNELDAYVSSFNKKDIKKTIKKAVDEYRDFEYDENILMQYNPKEIAIKNLHIINNTNNVDLLKTYFDDEFLLDYQQNILNEQLNIMKNNTTIKNKITTLQRNIRYNEERINNMKLKNRFQRKNRKNFFEKLPEELKNWNE